jgi:hypothetical protein
MDDKYFKIVVRQRSEFKTYEVKKDFIGEGVMRVAGKRMSGLWDTQAWLISQREAHIENRRLVPDTQFARYVVRSLASEPRWVKSNIFRARDRFKIP